MINTHTRLLGVLRGLSIDIMLFILYKLYSLSCNHTAKQNPHRQLSAFFHFQKTFII